MGRPSQESSELFQAEKLLKRVKISDPLAMHSSSNSGLYFQFNLTAKIVLTFLTPSLPLSPTTNIFLALGILPDAELVSYKDGNNDFQIAGVGRVVPLLK